MYLVKKWDFKKRMFLHNLLKPIVPALVKHCSQDCAIMRDTPHEHNLVEHYEGRDFSEPDFGHKTRGTVTRDLTYCTIYVIIL